MALDSKLQGMGTLEREAIKYALVITKSMYEGQKKHFSLRVNHSQKSLLIHCQGLRQRYI